MTLDILRKPKGQLRFSALPHRWLIERTLAWIVRCRRPDHDYERLPAHSEAMIKWAMIGLMTRRLAPRTRTTPVAVDPRGVTLSENIGGFKAQANPLLSCLAHRIVL